MTIEQRYEAWQDAQQVLAAEVGDDALNEALAAEKAKTSALLREMPQTQLELALQVRAALFDPEFMEEDWIDALNVSADAAIVRHGARKAGAEVDA